MRKVEKQTHIQLEGLCPCFMENFYFGLCHAATVTAVEESQVNSRITQSKHEET